jgi:hypothetical protein
MIFALAGESDMVADKRKHLFLRTCFTGLMLWAFLSKNLNLLAGLTIILFCISVIAFEVMGHRQRQPNIVTRPAKDRHKAEHHSSPRLETVFDYCPDCGAGEIVLGRDGKCTNCGYNLAKEVLENSKAVVACKGSPANQ